MKRRTYLAITGVIGTTGLAGCFLASNDDSNDNDNGEETSNEESKNTDSDTNKNDNEQANDEESLMGSSDDEENSEGGDTTNTSDDAENESQAPQDGNETNNESDEEEKPLSAEDAEPDREKYQENEDAGATGMGDSEQLPESAVSVSTKTLGNPPSFSVEGSVTNESDGHIDRVDIEIVWLDSNDDSLGKSVGFVQDLEPGESAGFRVATTTKELGEAPTGISGTAYPYRDSD